MPNDYSLRLRATGSASLVAAGGSFSLSGSAAGLRRNRTMTAAAGSFAMSGNAATLLASDFPLSVSSSGRYLQTSRGEAFPMNEVSAWAAFQCLSHTDLADFMTRRKAQGFNTLKVCLTSNWQAPPGSPPNWQGNHPFGTTNDFSTAAAATAYWNHIDFCFELARSKGIMIRAYGCYPGYFQDSSQGWADVINTANSAGNMATYGAFLGNRYRNQANLIWCFGGDQVPGTGHDFSVDQTKYLAFANALLTADAGAHRIGAHWTGDYHNGRVTDDPVAGGMLATDWAPLAASMTINGLYQYDPTELTHIRIEDGWALGLPVYSEDCPYGSGFTIAQPQGSDAEIREKTWRVITSGGCGVSFNAGSNWYLFQDWATDSQSQREAVIAYNAWAAQPWHTMAPDLDSSYLVSGRGSRTSASYVTAIRNSSKLMAYVPPSGAPVADMSKFAAAGARNAYWLNPTDASTTPLGSIAASGTHTFTNPSGSIGQVLIVG